MFLDYKPPKELRALFIIHYAPLLLIILIGPLSWIFDIYYAWTFKQLYNQDLLNKFYKTIIPYPEVKEIYVMVSNYLKNKLMDI